MGIIIIGVISHIQYQLYEELWTLVDNSHSQYSSWLANR